MGNSTNILSVGYVQEYVLYLGVFFLPFIQWGIPVGSYKLILSDLAIIICAIIFVLQKKIIFNFYVKHITVFVALLGTFSISAIFPATHLMELTPFIYGLIVSVIINSLYFKIGIAFFDKVMKTIAVSLSLSFTPAYLFLIGFKIDLTFEYGLYRYQYFTTNSNQYIAYVLLSLFTITVIIVKLHNRTYLVISTIIAFFSFYPVLLSGSRTGVLGVTLFFLIVVYYSFKEINIRNKLIIVGSIVLLTVYATTIYDKIISENPTLGRAFSVFDMLSANEIELDESAESRFVQVEEGIKGFYENPLLGIGLGCFKKISSDELEIHNSYFSILIETGIIGSCIFISIWISVFFRIYQTYKSKKDYVIYLLLFLLLMVIANSFMVFRERWTWLFICTISLINPIKNTSIDKKTHPIHNN